jgi:protein ImuA
MENKSAGLDNLRRQVAALEGRASWSDTLSNPQDAAFDPMRWTTGVLHDVYAENVADAAALNAFALGGASQTARGRAIVWTLQAMALHEGGDPYGAGLKELGIDPAQVLLVRVTDAAALLGVGEEALGNPAVGAVVLSAWGEAKAFTLTASRRLSLAAERSGGTVFLARTAAQPSPSAAETRWTVRSALSQPMEADAPGRPRVAATLTRRRNGGRLQTWIMEWDREARSFVTPSTPGRLVPLPAHRPAGARAA